MTWQGLLRFGQRTLFRKTLSHIPVRLRVHPFSRFHDDNGFFHRSNASKSIHGSLPYVLSGQGLLPTSTAYSRQASSAQLPGRPFLHGTPRRPVTTLSMNKLEPSPGWQYGVHLLRCPDQVCHINYLSDSMVSAMLEYLT